MPVVKVGTHHEVVIPEGVRTELGVKPGDLVEVTFRIVDAVPTTNEVLGPVARSELDAALKDIDDGRVGTPLETEEELRDYLDGLKQ